MRALLSFWQKVVLMLILTVGMTFAQESSQEVTDLLSQIGTSGQQSDQDPGGLIPEVFSSDTLSAEGEKALKDSLTAYYVYRIQGFDHRARVFEWQLFSTKVIFAMVLIIVLAGLYFSWMQFHSASDPNEMKESSLELGKSGIRVTSPVLGVIILSLSLAFFYLYLVHIYPIADAF
jgi:hypothetical protein